MQTTKTLDPKKTKENIWKGVNHVRVSDFVIALIIFLLCLTCIIPFLHVAAKSISSTSAVLSKQVYLWPKQLNFDAYRSIFRDGQMTHAMLYTILVTALFTGIGMIITTCAAYPLAMHGLKGRGFFAFILMFTMYFGAGLIPTYLLYKDLNLINTMWVLVLPLSFSPYNMLIMRSFIASTIPQSLYEAAELDGATHFQVLFRIVLPLSTSIIATLSLFYAVGRWNGYSDALMYMREEKYYTLQLLLYNIINNINQVEVATQEGFSSPGLAASLKAAIVMFSTIPILCVYPFLQRYFIAGVTLGAVKE